ncbi:XVIPCD domain-containing protein [Lysobacter firmicutimachus]|uniref:XVIPCD domain-containing protein n=1 Tax=Lysobacter firmicutimachus TaxID=1792846 RepID=A0AAU8MVF7_9GAMM
MPISSLHYAELSNIAYDPPEPNRNGQRDSITIGDVSYNIIDIADNRSSGYQGVMFQRSDTKEIVVAHRGTEFLGEPIDDVTRADGGMVARRANQQAADAIEFTRRAMERAEMFGVPITVTGHSLGGCLTQITAAKLGLYGETFNAFGAADLNMRIPEGGHQVVNHVMAADFVSSAGHHFGEVRVYASRHDVKSLSLAGYANNDRNYTDPRNFLVATGAGALSHSLHHFRDVDGNEDRDLSVLRDPETRVNAHRFEAMIDKFRSDVWALREGMSIGGAALRGPKGVAEEIMRHVPEKPAESPFKDAHGALPTGAARPFDPRHCDHPDHSMHGAIHAGVERIYAQQGRSAGEAAERTSAALLANARESGLTRVDHVVAGRNQSAGTDVFAVQGELHDPAHKRAQTHTELAEQIPLETSFQRLAALHPQQAAAEEQQSQEQTRLPAARMA